MISIARAAFRRAYYKIFVSQLNQILVAEKENPPFKIPNERPVEYAFVFKQLARDYPHRVLDVGTGITALPHLIANCGFRVTAIDNICDYWTSGMINRHFAVRDVDIKDYRADVGHDMVICVSTLEHIVDFEEAVKAMVRALQPGGLLVLTFPYNHEAFLENVYKVDGSDAPANIAFGAHAFSKTEVSGWIAKHELLLVDAEYWRFYSEGPWSVGPRLETPQRTAHDECHQIACLAFRKPG